MYSLDSLSSIKELIELYANGNRPSESVLNEIASIRFFRYIYSGRRRK